MQRRLGPLFYALLSLAPCALAQVPDTAARRCPSDVPIWIEVKNPATLIGDWTASPLFQLLDGVGAFAKLDDNQRQGKELLASILPLLGDSLGIGLRPEMTPPRVLICGKDSGKDGGSGLESFENAFRGAYPELPKGKKTEVNGAEALEFGALGTIARQNGWVFYSNADTLLKRTLKLKPADSLAATQKYADARAEHADYRVLLVGDLRPLVAQSADIKNPDNFLAVLLFHGLYDALLRSESTSAGFDFLPTPRFDLLFGTRTDSGDSWAHTETASIPQIADENLIGRLHIDRDLSGFWRKRLDIVGERARPSLAEFSQVLSIFFSGYSVEDVLAKLGRGIDIIATDRTMDPKAAPDVILPGFALVLFGEIDDELSMRWLTGFQTAIGVTNAGGGEENRQPMFMSEETFEGQKIITSRFLVASNVGTHGIEYNFTPSIAVTNTAVVIGMSTEATKVALRSLPMLSATRGDFAEVSVPKVVEYLKKNIGVMADARALSEGVSRTEAEQYLSGVFERLRIFSRVRVVHDDTKKGSRWSFVIENGAEKK